MYKINMSSETALVAEVQKFPCIYDTGAADYNRLDATNEAWTMISDAVQLPIHDCKDKWRNIRSSYCRSLKRAKKKNPTYYLAPHLTFLLPFLKRSNRLPVVADAEYNDGHDNTADQHNYSSNDSDKLDTNEKICIKIESDPIVSDAELFNDDVNDDDDDDVDNDDNGSDDDNDEDYDEKPAKKARKERRAARKYQRKNSSNKRKLPMSTPILEDQRKKIQGMTDSHAMRFFLLSLLPEFKTMKDDQVRTFKIKVMLLIDEIKSNSGKLRDSLRSSADNERLQKRLINLLLKNLEKQNNTEDTE